MNTTTMNSDSYELIDESPVSAIYRVHCPEDRTVLSTPYRAVKVSTANKRFMKEPHDIRKEIRLLCQLSHPNIIDFLGHDVQNLHYLLWMPYIPYELRTLLACPSFTPSPYSPSWSLDRKLHESRFIVLTKSIFHQILQALDYLHNPCRMIAHRDIKPGNILLTDDCQVKLIDFGIAWKSPDEVAGDDLQNPNDIWPESTDNMYTEVATGPYRAPELLFGPKSYDAFATDIWSLGATFAEFFTPLRLCKPDDDSDGFETDSSDDDVIRPAFLIPGSISDDHEIFWRRTPLFDAERGDIGLAWSIFKIRGTPNEEIWPTFMDLPHAKQITFEPVPPVNLSQLLPNLPSSVMSTPVGSIQQGLPESMTSSVLDLITRFLLYPQMNRLRPEQALQHPWFFTGDVPLVLPASSASATGNNHSCAISWRDQGLGYWLREVYRS